MSQINNSKNFQLSLQRASALATSRGDSYLTGEHLLFGLTEEPSVLALFKAFDVDNRQLQAQLLEELDRLLPPQANRLSQTPRQMMPTEAVQASIRRGAMYAQQANQPELDGVYVLLGLLAQEESVAVYLLGERGISSVGAKRWVAHGTRGDEATAATADASGGSAASALEQFAVNLNQRAREGKIDPLVGRTDEIQRTAQILCRRRKNNPLLVGDPGVGKTAIAEGLAKNIVEGNVPKVLANAEVYLVDMGAMVAGTKYRGDFENRVNALIKQAEANPNIILFIDEIHTVIGAGAASGGAMDAGNLLKPALSGGRLRVIGSTTFREYREVFEKDQALTRRFQKIDVNEPTQNEAMAILEGLKGHFEKHHEVSYTPEALRSAVELSVRYMTTRLLPDKAIDLIDEAGAHQRVVPEEDRKLVIDASEIEATLARITKIPVDQVSASDRDALASLEPSMKALIYGQNKAIEVLSNAIKLSRAGLREGERPIGSFLFTGPTGVGKTEVTKQLADQMGLKLVRFDMSEYMEPHSVSRLIGAPPGYVGHNNGGLLTEAVTKNPYCVLLLDEVEKAHPDIFNLLLQVMDRASLTDTSGRTVDFKNVILVMTTNAGATHAARPSIGFTKQDHSTDAMEVLNRTFSPEFRNRLDVIVQFQPLGKDDILRVVGKNLMALTLSLNARQVNLVIGSGVEDWLAEKGFDPKMGARPMARLIENSIKMPLANLLLFGELVNGGTAHVELDGEGGLAVRATANNENLTRCEDLVEA